MTVCVIYFQWNFTLLISLVISILLTTFLFLYIPFKKMRSKRKVLFIVLFIVFVFIAIISSIGFFGFKDSCEGLWDRHFVKDYEKNINSLEEAKEIFRELGYEQLKENSNQILVETQVEKSLMNIAQGEDKYSVSFMWTCYELHFNGELYSFWCGD